MSSPNLTEPIRLPPTTKALLDETARPYFLWWTDTTVGQLKEHLASPDPEERAYWMGALLREANTRDVWLFVTSDEIHGVRHEGESVRL
jgi:hypothetical protein